MLVWFTWMKRELTPFRERMKKRTQLEGGLSKASFRIDSGYAFWREQEVIPSLERKK